MRGVSSRLRNSNWVSWKAKQKGAEVQKRLFTRLFLVNLGWSVEGLRRCRLGTRVFGCVVVFDTGVFGRAFGGGRKRQRVLAGLGIGVWQNGLVMHAGSRRGIALLALVARC